MIAETASRTALMVAAYRARATRRPEPVCRDEWASNMAGALGLELSVAFDCHMPHMELWIALRTEFLDRQVRRLLDGGVDQVVVLGAGFDTRAARLARAGVRFFEVDHPDTQAEKRARLESLDGYPADAARYVACDFERGDDVIAGLAAADLSTARPAAVLWEGVTLYLSEEAVRQTASRLASSLHPESVLMFDYVGKKMAEGTGLRGDDAAARDEVARMGEPIRWGTNDPLPLLYDCGFRRVVAVSFDEIALSLTGTYDRERKFRFQGIAMASRSRDLL